MWESEFTAPNSLIPILSLSTQSNLFLQTIWFKWHEQFQDQAWQWKKKGFFSGSLVSILIWDNFSSKNSNFFLRWRVCFWLCKPLHPGSVHNCNMDGAEPSSPCSLQSTEKERALHWVLMESPSHRGIVICTLYYPCTPSPQGVCSM